MKVTNMRTIVGYWRVLVWMGSWVFYLGLSHGALAFAGEYFENSIPLIVEESDSAKEYLRLGINFFLTDELDVAID